MGDIGDRDTAFQIAQWLQSEPVPAARIEALQALGGASTFENAADTLYRFMSPSIEPDKSVREQAWMQFQRVLPYATNLVVLSRWASDFADDPSKRLLVLLVLNEKLQQNAALEDLAASRQNTGEIYLKLGDPAKAAIQFGQVLDYWQKDATSPIR